MRQILKPSPEINKSLELLTNANRQYVGIANGMIGVCAGLPRRVVVRRETTVVSPKIAKVLFFLLQGAGSSTNTLLDLSDGPGLHTRDCYGIARSIVETLVNACFVMAGGETTAKQAIDHAIQKSYTDLSRESKIGESVISAAYTGKTNLKNATELKNLVAKFTSRSGREKGWTDESIDDRIAMIGNKFGCSVLTSLHGARFSIYRHSSEFLHGTLFSAYLFFGISAPNGYPNNEKKFADFIGDQHLLLLIGVALGWSAVVEAFHASFGYGIAVAHSKKLWDMISKIPIAEEDKTES